MTGDRAALKHALTEVLLNALQANPSDPRIGVRLHADSMSNGVHGLQIEVRDNGVGFSPEAAQKGLSPFYTTRNVGLGLGLTVSRKIIETHHGKLEIVPPQSGQPGIVRVLLPVDSGISTAASLPRWPIRRRALPSPRVCLRAVSGSPSRSRSISSRPRTGLS